jgi:hypothetical protein
LAAALVVSSEAAGQSASSAGSGSSSGGNAGAASAAEQAGDGKTGPKATTSADLPVSLERIREGLKHAPAQPLRGLNEEAHFKVVIQERQKIEELLSTLDFKAGPAPAGGVYGSEMQRIARPPLDHPLAQPYAAFTNGELLTIALESLVIKYLGGRAIQAVTGAERARAEQAARDEVARSMSSFCASQPNRGAGLAACQFTPAVR